MSARGRGSNVGVGGAVMGRNDRLVDVFAALRLAVHPEPAEAPEDLSWQDLALCAETDPEAFFPEKGGSTLPAKQVCRGCEVRAECLDYALTHDDAGRFGVWGGFSERERRYLKRQNRPAAAIVAAETSRRRSAPAPDDTERQRGYERAHRARNAAKVAALTQSREAAAA